MSAKGSWWVAAAAALFGLLVFCGAVAGGVCAEREAAWEEANGLMLDESLVGAVVESCVVTPTLKLRTSGDASYITLDDDIIAHDKSHDEPKRDVYGWYLLIVREWDPWSATWKYYYSVTPKLENIFQSLTKNKRTEEEVVSVWRLWERVPIELTEEEVPVTKVVRKWGRK